MCVPSAFRRARPRLLQYCFDADSHAAWRTTSRLVKQHHPQPFANTFAKWRRPSVWLVKNSTTSAEETRLTEGILPWPLVQCPFILWPQFTWRLRLLRQILKIISGVRSEMLPTVVSSHYRRLNDLVHRHLWSVRRKLIRHVRHPLITRPKFPITVSTTFLVMRNEHESLAGISSFSPLKSGPSVRNPHDATNW